MTAGRGIVHSERSKNNTLEGIQLWVALPKDCEDVEPAFIHTKAHELPLIQKNEFDLRLIVGKAFDSESPIEVY